MEGQSILVHLPHFEVVICTECQYAIQPSAINGHLLAHGMYRKGRQRLLEQVSTLSLREADRVPTPDAHSPPQPHLPILEGRICTWPECGRALVSQKRMEQHWSRDHGESDAKKAQSRPAQLQTFFRGNKIRYFEVNRIRSGPQSTAGSSRHSTPSPSVAVTTQNQCVSECTTPASQDEVYLQHYRNSPRLIPHRDITHSGQFWYASVFEEASKHDFLMSAMLGLAAADLSSQAPNEWERERHRNASFQYQAQSTPSFLAALHSANAENSVALVVYGRFTGVQRLILHRLEEAYPSSESGAPDGRSELDSIVEMFCLFRGQAKVMLDLQDLLPAHPEFRQSIGMKVDFDDDNAAATATAPLADEEARTVRANDLAKRIEMLPRKLQALAAFESKDEAQIIEAAVTGCLVGLGQSFSSSGLVARWHGLSTFILALSPCFANMLKNHHPAALVLFGHWCPLLLALENDYAFLEGQSARLLRVLRRGLPSDLGSLLDGLESDTYASR